MTDDITPSREGRGLALAFALCAVATLALLANHPSGTTGGLAEFLKDAAAHQSADRVVHGGFILTLAALMVCFALLSRHLGSGRALVVIGRIAFGTGCGALMLSMLLDGFATPALAARFVGAADLQPMKTLLLLLGTLIRFLMPMGLLFQSIAMLSWSAVMARGRGLRRAVGGFGLAAALALIVAQFTVPEVMAAYVILGGIALQAIWYFGIAAVLLGSAPLVNGSKPA